MVVWECGWNTLCKQADVAAFLNSRQFTVPSLDPRDAFFGGRTNVVRLLDEIDETQGEKFGTWM